MLTSIKKLKEIANKKGLKYKDLGFSNRKGKKYYVINENDKKIHFGALGMDDYTITGNKEQRKRYRARHSHDKINNPDYAGF